MVLYLGRVVEIASTRRNLPRCAPSLYHARWFPRCQFPIRRRSAQNPPHPAAGELPSPLDTRAPLMFLKSKRIDDPDAEQYRPKLLEVAPGHFVAEHDPV